MFSHENPKEQHLHNIKVFTHILFLIMHHFWKIVLIKNKGINVKHLIFNLQITFF